MEWNTFSLTTLHALYRPGETTVAGHTTFRLRLVADVGPFLTGSSLSPSLYSTSDAVFVARNEGSAG